jgi:hypothetical protein
MLVVKLSIYQYMRELMEAGGWRGKGMLELECNYLPMCTSATGACTVFINDLAPLKSILQLILLRTDKKLVFYIISTKMLLMQLSCLADFCKKISSF